MAIFITVSILVLVGLLIILVNLFTLATILSSRLLVKPANYPIIFFLLTATFQGFVVVPAYCLKKLEFDKKFNWICDLFRFPYFLCGHLLTLNLVLVCIDRIIAIKYPLRYEEIVTRASMITGIVVETIIVFIVDLMPFGNTQDRSGDYCAYQPWAEWNIAVTTATIVVPLVFLTVSYAWIWLIALRLVNKQPTLDGRRKVSLTKSISNHVSKIFELRATKTSALLIGVFVLCWSPIAIYYLVENICGLCISQLLSKRMESHVSFMVKVMTFTSSILSPLAYCWRTREFKRELRKNLNKRRWKAARIALSFVTRAAKDSQNSAQPDAELRSESAPLERRTGRKGSVMSVTFNVGFGNNSDITTQKKSCDRLEPNYEKKETVLLIDKRVVVTDGPE